MQSHIDYICLTFLHCAISNVFPNHLPERRHSHISCIYMVVFPQYVFSNVFLSCVSTSRQKSHFVLLSWGGSSPSWSRQRLRRWQGLALQRQDGHHLRCWPNHVHGHHGQSWQFYLEALIYLCTTNQFLYRLLPTIWDGATRKLQNLPKVVHCQWLLCFQPKWPTLRQHLNQRLQYHIQSSKYPRPGNFNIFDKTSENNTVYE